MSPLTTIMFSLIFALAGYHLYRASADRGADVEAYAAGVSGLICVGLWADLVV